MLELIFGLYIQEDGDERPAGEKKEKRTDAATNKEIGTNRGAIFIYDRESLYTLFRRHSLQSVLLFPGFVDCYTGTLPMTLSCVGSVEV